MKTKNSTGKGKYVKAKTREAREKQKIAIVNYYAQKRAEKNKKGWL